MEKPYNRNTGRRWNSRTVGGHAGFSPIRNHLDRVQEVLSLRAQSCESILFRKVLHWDLSGRFLALLFELSQAGLELFDPFLPVALMLFIDLDGGLRQELISAHVLLLLLITLQLCILLADLAIELSPGRVENGHSSRNLFRPVLH